MTSDGYPCVPERAILRIQQPGAEGRREGGMAQVKIEDGRLVVVVDGLARLLTSRKQVAVALAHITAVEARAEPPRSPLEHLKHMTQAGTHISRIIQLGTLVPDDWPGV